MGDAEPAAELLDGSAAAEPAPAPEPEPEPEPEPDSSVIFLSESLDFEDLLSSAAAADFLGERERERGERERLLLRFLSEFLGERERDFDVAFLPVRSTQQHTTTHDQKENQ